MKSGLKIVKTVMVTMGADSPSNSVPLLEVSEDLKHYAALYRLGAKFRSDAGTPLTTVHATIVGIERGCLVDGVKQRLYPYIDPLLLKFNPEGSVLAYQALVNKQVVTVINGQEHGTWDEIRSWDESNMSVDVGFHASRKTWINYSPTGTNWAFSGVKDKRRHLVVNGRHFGESSPFGGFSGHHEEVNFSSDGTSWGAIVSVEGKYQVVLNGEIQPFKFSSVGANSGTNWMKNYIGFSGDGTSHAYAGKRNGDWYVVKDGREHGPYDRVGVDENDCSLSFSHAGTNLIYYAKAGGKESAYVDGTAAGPGYKRIAPPLLRSRTNAVLAYRAQLTGGKQVVVWGDQVLDLEGERNLELVNGGPKITYFFLSDDGRDVFYNTVVLGLSNPHTTIWHNGKKVKAYARHDLKEAQQLVNPSRVVAVLDGGRNSYRVTEDGKDGDPFKWIHPLQVSNDRTYFTMITWKTKDSPRCYPGNRFFDYDLLPTYRALSEGGRTFAVLGTRKGKAYLNVNGVESEPFDDAPIFASNQPMTVPRPRLVVDDKVVRVIMMQDNVCYRVECPLDP